MVRFTANPSCAGGSCFGILRWGASEGLLGSEFVPGGFILDFGNVQAHPAGFYFENALTNADVDRAALGAGRATVAPVAQITLGEVVFDRVVRDARFLPEHELVGGVGFGTGGKDARLGAAIAGDAGILSNEARARGWLDMHGVDRADVQAFRGGSMQTRFLVTRAAARISGQPFRVNAGRRVVVNPDARQVGQALLLVDLRADDLTGQAPDA